MDSTPNKFDAFLPKVEADNDRESCRIPRLSWTQETTLQLIKRLEQECHELWNSKHPGYRDKAWKQMKYEYLAELFDTTVEEITRKIHNLRTQYNNELRKLRKRQGDGAGAGSSGWEYFDSLHFLKPPLNDLTPDPLELTEVNLELAEFQAEEEEEFRRCKSSKEASQACSWPGRKKPVLRVAASAPPPMPASANPLLWPEQPGPRIRPSLNADECQIFGDFVASELRTLRSHESRKKLKRLIQKAILQVGEEEDVNIINP